MTEYQYNRLKAEGFLWELFPYCTGIYIDDLAYINEYLNNLEEYNHDR